jgi:phage gp29-like protein
LQILWAGLMQWMGIATSSHTGARATAQVQDEPYYMLVEAHAADLALEIQRQEVRRFVDVNFGEEIATPTLTVSKIQSEDVAQLAQTLSELHLAGFDFSDAETQNDVRERMHLPDLPDSYTPTATEGSGLPTPPPVPPEQKPPAEQQDG